MDDTLASESGHADPPGQLHKLALVIHALYGGGAERLMSQLASRWSQAGHEVHLITLAASSTDTYEIDQRVHRHGLDLMNPSGNVVSGLLANWTRVKSLRKCLQDLAPDRILSFCDRMNIVTLTAALQLPMPIWIAEHSDPQRQILGLFWETWRQWSYRGLARRKHGGCVVLTPAIAHTMAARFPGLTLKVIPPAIHLPTDDVSTDSDWVTGTQAEGGAHKRIVFLGRLSPEKNVHELLVAWQQLAPAFPQWQLIIAGDGPERDRLQAFAREQSLPRVEFPGWIADPRPLLAAADLFVLPSRYEGFPVALLEAMGLGVACLSTPCSTALDALAQTEAVVVTDSSTASSLVSSLTRLMADAPRRALLAQRGKSAAQEFAWSRVGLLWDELL